MAETIYKKPGVVSRLSNRVIEGVTRLGISPAGAHTLAVRGRRSGEMRTNPVNPLELDGQTYLVSPRGTSHWVRNLRAAGGGELRVGRKATPFRAVEVTDSDKTPILRAYLDRWAWETGVFFEIERDPSDETLREIAPRHPVFRLRFER